MRERFGRRSREYFRCCNRTVRAEPATAAEPMSQSRLFISDHHPERVRIALNSVDSDRREAQSFGIRNRRASRKRSVQIRDATIESRILMHQKSDGGPRNAIRR